MSSKNTDNTNEDAREIDEAAELDDSQLEDVAGGWNDWISGVSDANQSPDVSSAESPW